MSSTPSQAIPTDKLQLHAEARSESGGNHCIAVVDTSRPGFNIMCISGAWEKLGGEARAKECCVNIHVWVGSVGEARERALKVWCARVGVGMRKILTAYIHSPGIRTMLHQPVQRAYVT